MIQNNYLRQADTLLNKHNFCYLKEENVLAISEDKSTLPHAFVLTDESIPNTILLSFAIDYPRSSEAAAIALELRKITHVSLVEDFYIAKNGITHWGDDAAKYYTFETQIDLATIDPENKNLN